MSSYDRRAAARRRAWGRGPMILRFEPLEGRQLLATTPTSSARPDLVATAFDTVHTADWNDAISAKGTILNQGTAPVPEGATVSIYASRSIVIGPGSVLIGVVPVTAGLAPGESQTFDQEIILPPSPVGGMTGTNLWIGLRIDAKGQIRESNELNNEGRGQGVDQSVVTIAPVLPSNLIGTSFGVGPTTTLWGHTVTVVGQVKNNAQGEAPTTRARIVLTPNGQTPGGRTDITIGSIQVPAIAPFGTANVSQEIILPAAAPSILQADQGAYLISMIQDADVEASNVVERPTIQGVGLDTAVITIGAGPNADVPIGPRAELAASAVVVPTGPIYWGQTIQLSTAIQNLGKGDAPPFKVRFLLTGTNGLTDHAVFLGDAIVTDGLRSSFGQSVIQTVKLPSRLPFGYNVAAVTYGRIVVIVDPENQIDEPLKTNNDATSAPVTLRLLGADGTSTVPTTQPVRANAPLGTSTATTTPAVPLKPGAYKNKKKAAQKAQNNSIIKQITAIPNSIVDFFKKLVNPKKKK